MSVIAGKKRSSRHRLRNKSKSRSRSRERDNASSYGYHESSHEYCRSMSKLIEPSNEDEVDLRYIKN